MMTVKGLNRRVDRLLKKADEIQKKHRRSEVVDKELRRMERMYLEASTIVLTLEVVKNDMVSLLDS